MAYTPTNWNTGDVITAERLNKMDNGWEVILSNRFDGQVNCDTAVGNAYANSTPLESISLSSSDEYTVDFDGVNYGVRVPFGHPYGGICMGSEYNASDPEEFYWEDEVGNHVPFLIIDDSANGIMTVACETSGTHTLIIKKIEQVNVSDFFKLAVKAVTGAGK